MNFYQAPSLKDLLKLLPPRAHDSHKGDFGHVLIVGGAPGMLGAVILVSTAAARTGAGLVTVATHPSHAPLVSVAQPTVMSYGIKTAAALKPLLAKATVVVIGPGLGQDAWAKLLLKTVLASKLPLVIDADALNLIAKLSKPPKLKHAIITPHPGEAARLLKTTAEKIQADRVAAAQKLQQRFGSVVVLKGAGTIVQAENESMLCNLGNPGMASGGMGDVLSGIIAALVAQKLSLFDAARLGVMMHAKAGDEATKQHGERGLLATDLLEYL